MLKLVARILKLVTELSSMFKRSNYFDNPTKLCPHLLPVMSTSPPLFLCLCYCFFSVLARFIISSLVSSGQIEPTYCVVPGQIYSGCMSAREWKGDKLLCCWLTNSAGRWL